MLAGHNAIRSRDGENLFCEAFQIGFGGESFCKAEIVYYRSVRCGAI